VLGPRGVAAVPLPVNIAVQTAADVPGAAGLMEARPVKLAPSQAAPRLMRPVGVLPTAH
jgi:hypothetical protein